MNPAYRPTPEAIQLIRQFKEQRATGKRRRPYAKEIYSRLGVSEQTFYKLVKQVQT